MFVVSVELLHGTFRGDPTGAALTGNLTHGEWPPSPARLFGAMVAADGTGDRCRVTSGGELEWLEALEAPHIYADPRPSHQELAGRFVVIPDRAKNTMMEYVARMGGLVRPGFRVSVQDRMVHYVWGNDAPKESDLEALRLRAARIGYLGTADSPVRVRVMTELPAPAADLPPYVPDEAGEVAVSVTSRGHIALLDELYKAQSERGPNVTRSQYPALRRSVAYRSPLVPVRPDRGEVVAWMQLASPVSGRRVSTITALFKAAVLCRYQELHGEPPPTLHGHVDNESEKGYEIARYLALPHVGYRYSSGRIHGLAVWLPPGTDATERVRTREATMLVRELRGGGIRADVSPTILGEGPRTAQPGRWTSRSRSWVTAFPAIHERHGPVTLDEVSRWCRHAGLPGPASFRSTRTPLVRGAVDLAPVEVRRKGRPGRPYSHIELHFNEEVEGPVVIGAGRQRGFGLCIPKSEPRSAS